MPIRFFPGRFTNVPADDSVSPYPSRMVNPSTSKKCAIFGESGAPPETKSRILPPNRSFSACVSFGNTSFLPMVKPNDE